MRTHDLKIQVDNLQVAYTKLNAYRVPKTQKPFPQQSITDGFVLLSHCGFSLSCTLHFYFYKSQFSHHRPFQFPRERGLKYMNKRYMYHDFTYVALKCHELCLEL